MQKFHGRTVSFSKFSMIQNSIILALQIKLYITHIWIAAFFR